MMITWRCAECGWSVLTVPVNGAMAVDPRWAGNDWWSYCTNKACVRHVGESVFQDAPDWVENVEVKGPAQAVRDL